MQVSTRFSMAMHILLCIGYFSGKAKTTSAFIASSVNANPVVIRRVLGQLKEAGLVTVEAGVGGASLAKDPADITMLDVFRAVDSLELAHVEQRPRAGASTGCGILDGMEDVQHLTYAMTPDGSDDSAAVMDHTTAITGTDDSAADVGDSRSSERTATRAIAIPRGTVVLAATPIGNDGDASARLIALLEHADIARKPTACSTGWNPAPWCSSSPMRACRRSTTPVWRWCAGPSSAVCR